MMAETVAAFGRIDTLVNNAGVTRRADIMDLTEEDWDRTHRVNAKGVFFCLQRAAREMIPRRSGRIINIASIAGKGYAGTSNAIYAASKGAVISLTKTAAQQLGPYNINVNAVCPGIVRTAMWREINRVLAEKEGRSPEEVEAASSKPSHPPGQRAGGYRRHGGIPGIAAFTQRHGPGIQCRRRAGTALSELLRPPAARSRRPGACAVCSGRLQAEVRRGKAPCAGAGACR